MIKFFIKDKIFLFYCFFVLMIFLLIFERFVCNQSTIGLLEYFYLLPFSNSIFNNLCKNEFFNFYNIWEEGKFVENLQSIFIFLAIIYLFISLKKINIENKKTYFFIIIQIIGLTYFLGEEISWGQHLFNWKTPEFFSLYNIQNETNVHNMSNLLNELPRSLVLIWCSLSIFIILIAKQKIKINKILYFLVFPNKNLLLISLLLLFFAIPDLIIDKFDLHPNIPNYNFNNEYEVISYQIGKPPPSNDIFNLGVIYEQISFNFLRLSELHELIFSFYFFIYSFALNKNIKSILSPLRLKNS